MGQFDSGVKTAVGGVAYQQIVCDSKTVVATMDGVYLITAIGAGGSGAKNASANGMAATGGGAGGFCQKKIRLKIGDPIMCTVGAGGEGVAGGVNGNSGGATVVKAGGFLLTAKGGAGGTQSTGAVTVPGAAGGMAYGGDANVQGGGSGSATTVAVALCNAQTGGGAVGIYGIGYPSGNASSSGAYYAITGGAGVGGSSGSVTSSTASAVSYGGGQHDSAGSIVNGVGSTYPSASNSMPVSSRFLSPCGNKSYGVGNQYNYSSYPGAGGSSVSQYTAYNGTEFCGGAGGAGGAIAPYYAGAGMFGGGGGATSDGYYSTTNNSGAGGNGVVVIEYLGG